MRSVAMTLVGRSARGLAAPGGVSRESCGPQMGLGKTVELLACVMANPRPERGAKEDDVTVAVEQQGSPGECSLFLSLSLR